MMKDTIYIMENTSNQHTHTLEFLFKMRPSCATQLGYKLKVDPWLHLLVPLDPNLGLNMGYPQFSRGLITSFVH